MLDADFQYGGWILLAVVCLILYSICYVAWLHYQNARIRQMTQRGVLLEVVLEKDTETKHLAVEQMWAAFHSGLYIPWHKRIGKPQPYITFEIKSEHTASKDKNEISFNFWMPEEYRSMIKQRILSLYPKAQVRELTEDYIPEADDRLRVIETVEMGLKNDSSFAVKIFDNYDADPLSSITAAMTELENKEIAVVQVLTRPMPPSWRAKAEKTLLRYERNGRIPSKMPEWTLGIGSFFGFFFMLFDGILDTIFQSKAPAEVDTKGSKFDSDNQKQILEKAKRNPFAFEVRILVGTPFGPTVAKEKVRNIVAAFKEMDGPHNSFEKHYVINKKKTYTKMKSRFLSVINNDDVLTTVELAGFGHLPNMQNFTPGLKRIQSKRTEIPFDSATDDPFAVAMDMTGNERPIGLDLNGRMRHIYVSGMTGVGKSTLLENMIVRDIETGRGAIVIDPHGELVDVILEKISTDREDVFVLDPADLAYPFGMNMLEVSASDPLRREMEKVLVIDAYITTMKRVFGEGSIGANTDDIFR